MTISKLNAYKYHGTDEFKHSKDWQGGKVRLRSFGMMLELVNFVLLS